MVLDLRRLWRTFRICVSRNRSAYIRKAKIFANFGENSTISSRIVPIYPELIWIGNNVRLAAKVSLVPHDMIHAMLNNMGGGTTRQFKENIGCIRIEDNVFVGTNTTILADVHIGRNVIVGAGSLVNKDLKGGYVYAGVPAKPICRFDVFVEKRKQAVAYPQEYHRIGDSVPCVLAEWLWNDFKTHR